LRPSAEVDDATFLRRVSIDLLGRVPTLEELRTFTASSSPTKRAAIVDELLDSPAHATHLARVWDRILLGPEVKARVVDRGALQRWLEQRFSSDAPWDAVVRDLISAEGKTSVGGVMQEAQEEDNAGRAETEKQESVNGAANYSLRFAQSPQDMAGQT